MKMMDMRQLTPSQVLQEREKRLARRGSWLRLAISVACTAACTLILFGLVLGIAVVRGSSMNPAFREDDLVLFSRLGRYSAGDVVILLPDSAGLRKYVKRVVGVPGDTVDISYNGGVRINGLPLEEPYAAGFTQRKELAFPIQLGPGEYFVLGDNRENSSDSRNFGAVTADHVSGKVLAVLRAGIRE